MEKIINLLIKEFIEGVDTYTHNGSTWLIFTDSKQWVIELTKEKTLWYNYTFFKEIFEYTSTDVVENQHHITKWVEDNIIKGVKEIYDYKGHRWEVKDVIKETIECDWNIPKYVINEVVDDGVKETKTPGKDGDILGVMDWMEENKTNSVPKMIDDVIENGVKETKYANRYDSIGPVFKGGKIENVIENGVKVSGTFVGGKRQKEDVESVIGYGTKNPTY